VTVRARLILTFALVGVLLLVPTFFAALGLRDLRDLAVEGRSRHAEATLALGRLGGGLADLDAAVRTYVGLGENREPVFRTLDTLHAELSRIEAAGYTEAVPLLRTAIDSVGAEVAVIDSLVQQRQLLPATEMVENGFGGALSQVRERLVDLAAGIDRRAQLEFERARGIGADTLRTTLVAVLVTLALALLLGAWTTRALTNPLRQLRTALARVTEGDFDAPHDLPYERHDEIGELSVSFGIMSKRLAELDRLRAEFLGVASHELKTPINVIRGYTELIEEELAGELTPHQREIMQRIEEQTRVLTRQVSRLMDISRLESGSYTVEAESVLLSDLILGLERTFEILAMEKDVTLSTEIDPGAPEWLEVDVDLIRNEVLANLVSNALKFTPEGGIVHVRAWGEGDSAVIEVADTGPGIPREHRAHVFEKYYQVERSHSLVGSGLGLAIAKEMVEVHGGTLALVDDDAPGATFRVTLPVRSLHSRPQAKGARSA